MAKRTVQRLLALALAGSMSLSVLATAAMAVDYDIAGGTVNVTDDGSGVQSWQGDGEKSSDTTINITNKENITTDQQVVNVGEGVGSDVTINIDGVNADVTDTSAVEANGGTVNIEGSSLSGGTEDEAAVVVGGDANVNISGETEIIGSGTGLEVNGGSVTVKDGADVTIVGNETTVTGGENDVSGTGVEVTGGTVTVEEGAEVEITGSDVTVNGEGDKATVDVSGTGVNVSGGELNVEGKVDTLGAAVSAPAENKSSFTVDFAGSTGMEISGGTVNVAQGGEVVTSDYTASNKSKGYYPYYEDPNGNYIFYKDGYRKIINTAKRNGVLSYKVQISSSPKKEEWVPVEGFTRYVRGKYTTAKMTTEGAGTGSTTGLDLQGNAQLNVDGNLLATGSKTGIAMADSVKVTVGPDGKLVTNYISKNGGTIDNEGLVFVQNAAEGLREAINNSGTGLRFVSYEKVPADNGGYGNVLHLYWDIGKGETAVELKVPLKDMAMAAWNALYCAQKKQFTGTISMPGDHFNFDIVITNQSGYTYTYKADSLVVDVGEAAKHAAANGDLIYLNSRVADAAIQALYGKTSSGKVTLEELLAVEKTLRTTGYKGQTFDSLEEYYLYFIEEKTGNRYDALTDVPYEAFNIALHYDSVSFQNSTFYISEEEYEAFLNHVNTEYADREYEIYDTGKRDSNGNRMLQIKQTSSVDAQLVYRYKYCLVYGFGDTVTNRDANQLYPPYSTELPNLLEYGLDHQLWQDSNDYFASLTSNGLAQNGSMNAWIYLLLDGPLTSNALECSAFAMENYIILTRPADPEKPGTPPVPEEPGTPPPNTPDDRLRGGYGSFALADNFVNEITIEDEDVPLADVPKTGDLSMLWLVLSGLCAAAMLLGMKRRRTTQA